MLEADERAIKSQSEVVKICGRTRRSLRQKVINGTVALHKLLKRAEEGMPSDQIARELNTNGVPVKSCRATWPGTPSAAS